MKKAEKSIDLGGRKLTLKTGILAGQATSAVLASYGDTVVLATVVAQPQKFDIGYFPLFVEYQERLYAGGRIKGSRWVKREGRPTDEEILTGRLIDRSIRPLFPKSYKKEVQVMVMVLSVDLENDPSTLSSIAASAALSISSIPWMGPVATVRVGSKEGAYFVNPMDSEMSFSNMDLVVTASKDAVVMVEAGAREATEEEILKGMEFAQGEINKVIGLIEDLTKEVGEKKEAIVEKKAPAELVKQVKKLAEGKIPEIISAMSKFEGGERSSEYEDLIKAVSDTVSEEEKAYVFDIIEELKKHYIRDLILSGKRTDGRKHTEIRPLSAEVGVLPRTHGSAIFARGTTQALTVATLGAPSMGQLIETAEGEEEKRYMHHYSMPPYSTGEVGRVGSPSRREIGHGALAERALEPVIPSEDVFPYAIRVVSEIMSSNGSTSMASVCGSTLSLMDAGVPLTSPVAGIAMGLILDGKKHAILSDIAGIEDFNGDMDFKVAGTSKGVTALQLDVKTLNLTIPVLEKALQQAKIGRAHIMETILKTIPESRKAVSNYAPKIKVVKVAVEKIGEVIGPGGKTIKKIISETGAQVEVEDDGSVNISATNEEALTKAVTWVESLVKEVQAGEVYEGTVARIQPFGAFVNILPGKDGLVHVSDMGEEFVKDPADVVSEGQKVQVRVKEVDNLGRINLSMRMDPSKDVPREERGGGERRFERRGDDRGGFSRGPRQGGFSRGGRPGGFSRDRRGSGDRQSFGERSGPHFPTSRYLDDKKKNFDR